MTTLTKSQLRSSAKRLRDYFLSDEDADGDRLDQLIRDFDHISAYRQSFAGPMLKVRMGLQSFVRTNGMPEADIAQRLKRLPRILSKLKRYPQMQIVNMQDIAGCRVVVEDLREQQLLARHILKRWDKKGQIAKLDDYINKPKDSGYRAIHVVAIRDGCMVEIQVRTQMQQAWADGVETISRSLGEELKWGDGPAEILKYFEVLSDMYDQYERGNAIPADRVEELHVLREAAQAITNF